MPFNYQGQLMNRSLDFPFLQIQMSQEFQNEA